MERAWPFEGHEDPPSRVRSPEDFLAKAPGGAEAVVVRMGLNGAQLVLVDRAGRWDRWIYPSVNRATEIAETLGIPVHVGSYPEELRVSMNAHRRTKEDFDSGAYPEQGRVGPVIPYPENRPVRRDPPEQAQTTGTS